MSTFQGFNVTGIDPNQYPVFTSKNDMLDNFFYLTLKPIGADADSENRKLWDYCFRRVVENWGLDLSELEFAFYADLGAVITVSGKSLEAVDLFYIEIVVKKVNERFVKETGDIIDCRAKIERINESFRNRVINM